LPDVCSETPIRQYLNDGGDPMAKYMGKRLLSSLLTLLLVSIIIFSLVHLIPGDPAAIILGPDATVQSLEKVRAQMGFDKPIVKQYMDWITGALRGDLGVSYYNNAPVTPEIIRRLAPSLTIAVIAQLVAILISIPLGVVSAKNKGCKSDYAISVFTLLGVSVPNFLLSLFLVLILGVGLKVLPVSGYGSLSNGLWGYFKYLVMPIIALSLAQAGLLTRMTKSTMSDIINTDFMKAAKAKGLSERNRLYKHALRNTLNPILTIVGQTFGSLIAGTAIIEIIFNIPGIGQLIVTSITKRDYAQLQGIILTVSVIYISINLIVDLLYGVVDPRIKLTGKKEGS